MCKLVNTTHCIIKLSISTIPIMYFHIVYNLLMSIVGTILMVNLANLMPTITYTASACKASTHRVSQPRGFLA